MKFIIHTRLNVKLVSLLLMLIAGMGVVQAQDGVLPLPGSENSSFGSRVFAEAQQLTASDSVAEDYFGWNLALDGATLIAASQHTHNASNSPAGAAYVFERSGGTWAQVARLAGSDTVSGDEFGFDVAVQGNVAVIGAPNHDVSGKLDQGAVYLFRREAGGIWTQWQKLIAADGLANQRFGAQVDIDGDRIVIGAGSAAKAYVYKRNAAQMWEYEAPLFTAGSISDVKLHGLFALVGSSTEESAKGAAYLYQYNGTTWAQVKRLTASDGVMGDAFGVEVGLQNGQAFVHASLNTPAGKFRGAVYVFSDNGGTWTQTQKLASSDLSDFDRFGEALDVDGETLAISSRGDELGAGSVYLFKWNGSNWVQDDKIEAVGGYFGISVAVQDGTLAASAPYLDAYKGRVFVYGDPLLTPAELLVNGGFESSDTGWTVKNPTSDKVKCNKPTKTFAYTGECAWRFKGGAGENAKIQQTITSGVTSGDVLTLSGYVNATGAVNGKLKLVVKYADGVTPKGKITINLTGATSGYVPLSILEPALTVNVAAPVQKIKLMVKNSSASGKIYYDDLSLTAQ